MKPPTLAQFVQIMVRPQEMARPFSSGSEYADWQHRNCGQCHWFNADVSVYESKCALDSLLCVAYFGHGEVPRQALEHFCGTDASAWLGECRFRKDRGPDRDPRPSPPNDPAQLVLIADPTEVIAGVKPATLPAEVHA